MPKNNKPNHDDAAEYLARVDWENQQVYRGIPIPARMVPKWKYKKVVAASATHETEAGKNWRFVGIAIAVLCAGSAYFLWGTMILPVLLIIFFFVTFLWLAVRDASKEPRDDD